MSVHVCAKCEGTFECENVSIGGANPGTPGHCLGKILVSCAYASHGNSAMT